MPRGYTLFLLLMILLLIFGAAIFVYGVQHPSSLPRLTPRNLSAAEVLTHG